MHPLGVSDRSIRSMLSVYSILLSIILFVCCILSHPSVCLAIYWGGIQNSWSKELNKDDNTCFLFWYEARPKQNDANPHLGATLLAKR